VPKKLKSTKRRALYKSPPPAPANDLVSEELHATPIITAPFELFTPMSVSLRHCILTIATSKPKFVRSFKYCAMPNCYCTSAAASGGCREAQLFLTDFGANWNLPSL
jgi:hypothetical protein